MNALFTSIFITLHAIHVKSGMEANQARLRRDLWLYDPIPFTQAPKYSWFCRDCDMKVGFPDIDCQREGQQNGETYSLEPCSGKQMCEILLNADPNEEAVWTVESSPIPATGPVTDVTGLAMPH